MEHYSSVGAPRRRWLLYGVLVVLLLIVPTVVPNQYELYNAALLGTYLIGVMALNLVQASGQTSLGHSVFYLIGGYTVAILTVKAGMSEWLTFPIAVAICGAVGMVLSLPAIRIAGFTFVMLTFGYALVASDLVSEWSGLTGGGDGLVGVLYPAGISDLESYYWMIVVAVVVVYIICHNLLRSPFGRAARAGAIEPVSAAALGIRPFRYQVVSFGISAGIAGLAGALTIPMLGFASAAAFPLSFAMTLLLMVLLGGSATIAGPIIGTVILFRLPIEVQGVVKDPGNWSLLVYGVILLLAVYFVPSGIMGGWWRMRGWLSRRWAWVQPQWGMNVVRSFRSEAVWDPELGRFRADLRNGISSLTPAADGDVLSVCGVAKNLGGVQALAGVSLNLRPGQVHALIGPNGSGKTTFLNVAMGYIAMDAGTVVLGATDLTKRATAFRARAGLARTFQTARPFRDMTCLENVMVAVDRREKVGTVRHVFRTPASRRAERRSYQRAWQLLDSVGLRDRAEVDAGSLPPGELRLLELARAVALEPRAMLMDEPAAGLTSGEIDEFGAAIVALQDAAVGVVLVEHHASMVMNLSDVVTVIDFGKVLASGTPDDIKRDPRVIEAYLGESLEDGRPAVTAAGGED